MNEKALSLGGATHHSGHLVISKQLVTAQDEDEDSFSAFQVVVDNTECSGEFDFPGSYSQKAISHHRTATSDGRRLMEDLQSIVFDLPQSRNSRPMDVRRMRNS